MHTLFFGINSDTSTNGDYGYPVTIDYEYDDVRLGNESDTLILQMGGVIIDSVMWDDGATIRSKWFLYAIGH